MPISAGSVNFTTTSSGASQLIQTVTPQMLAGNLNFTTTTPAGTTLDQATTASLIEASAQQLNLSTVTVDMPTLAAGNATTTATDENGGVLLCNLDELSR